MSTLECEQTNEMIPNFFTSEDRKKFPVIIDGKLPLLQFLESVKDFITMYDLLGGTFTFVKSDMAGNIEKLHKVYQRRPVEYEYVDDMLATECNDKREFAIDALLWLKRALDFGIQTLHNLCDDCGGGGGSSSSGSNGDGSNEGDGSNDGDDSDDSSGNSDDGIRDVGEKELSEHVFAAYDSSLCKYHGWVTRKVFKVACKTVPYRATAARSLYLGRVGGSERTLYKDAVQYLTPLQAIVEHIDHVYVTLGLSMARKCK